MEREIGEFFLRKVEERVALRQIEIDRQISQIHKLARRGQDSRQARAWLFELEADLNQQMTHRSYLKQRLLPSVNLVDGLDR